MSLCYYPALLKIGSLDFLIIETTFSGKRRFPCLSLKVAQIKYFRFFWKMEYSVFVRNGWKTKELNILCHPAKIVYSIKIWFSSFRFKALNFRLQDSLKNYMSQSLSLIFYCREEYTRENAECGNWQRMLEFAWFCSNLVVGFGTGTENHTEI